MSLSIHATRCDLVYPDLMCVSADEDALMTIDCRDNTHQLKKQKIAKCSMLRVLREGVNTYTDHEDAAVKGELILTLAAVANGP